MMKSLEKDLKLFMRQYLGDSSNTFLKKEFNKADITDIQSATTTDKKKLINNICHDLFKPLMSRGRVSLARSKLMGILDVKPLLAEIPSKEAMTPIVVDYFKNTQELIIKKEIIKYGVSDVNKTTNQVRIDILASMMKQYFGDISHLIIQDKLEEFKIKDIDSAPETLRLLLMESIMLSLIDFCVKPVTGRMIRSELISILKLDLYHVQGIEDPTIPEKLKKLSNHHKIKNWIFHI